MSGNQLVKAAPDKRSGDVVIHAAPLPFSNKQVSRIVPYGLTLQDMVDSFRPEGDVFGCVVLVDGERVPAEMWPRVRPLVGTNVAINIVPQGGGGKKNPLASLLSIALLVAAPYIASSITLALANSTALTALGGFGNAIIAGKIGAAIVGVVGSMLINAIAPPPKPSNLGTVNNPAESPTMFIEGARNAIDPYGVVPIGLGTNRMFPKQAGRPYAETKDNDQYVRQLFTWGFGKCVLSDFKIGETPIDEFDGVDMQHKLAGNMHTGMSLYPNDPYQDDFTVLLQEVDGFTTRTTQPDADEATVDVTFVQGLAEFNDAGKRLSATVQLEVQYAPYGVSPQVWSAPVGDYKAVAASEFTPGAVAGDSKIGSYGQSVSYYRKDIVVIDLMAGKVSLIAGAGTYSSPSSARIPSVPEGSLKIATVTVQTTRSWSNPSATTTLTVENNRTAAQVGPNYQSSGDFAPTIDGSKVKIAAGGVRADPLKITAAQTEALRRSVNIKFPERGQYDIRIRRVTDDTNDDQLFDKVTLTAIKTFTYRAPVKRQGLSGTAMRMKATEQLNGAVDEFNAIHSLILPDYDEGADVWIERVSSNPASLYRFVLQNYGSGGTNFANARPLATSKIDVATLEEWHILCTAKGYNYNRVIDYDTSVDEVLRDIAAAGAASPDIQDGKRTVVMDCEKEDIAQVITPRNSWGYQGIMTYPDLPHAFRVQFRNKAKGYVMDERKVFDDGYSEDGSVPGTVAATKFETLELVSTTDSDLAFKHGRRHIATARLQPESHSWMMDVENLVAVRGNRVKFAHDAPIIGIGDGRIKALVFNNDSPQLITGIVVDDTITIPKHGVFYVRIRCEDGTTLYKEVNEGPGSYTQLTFTQPFQQTVNEDEIYAPAVGDLCYFVEAGGELDLIITRIEPQGDLTARITGVDYAPARFTAETTTIPAFESNITVPISLVRPTPPVVVGLQSDESVMLRNSDGSYTSRCVITLINSNEGDIATMVTIRETGTDVFRSPNVLESTPTRVVITGMEDGTNYDIAIRYRRPGGLQYSLPAQVNGYKFVGASSTPADVTGFLGQIVDSTINLKWNPNPDIDISHYKIKFAKVFSGASWATAQTLEDNIEATRLTTTYQSGTYLIKAVDILGNESENPALIVPSSEGVIRNVVEEVIEEPDFSGAKDNVVNQGSTIVLGDPSLIGYYYFDETVDVGEVFTSYISAAILANGTYVNNLFDMEDMFAEEDLFGQLGGDLFAADDLFALDDMFGIGAGAWAIQLQFRTTVQDPGDSPVLWTDWAEFIAGNRDFRAIQFRLMLQSFAPSVSPQVTSAQVLIDMPDRVEAGSDLIVPVTGLRVNFDPPFKSLKGVATLAQDLAPGDVLEVTNKDETGFDVIAKNDVGAPVERTLDYVAKGYGRVIT